MIECHSDYELRCYNDSEGIAMEPRRPDPDQLLARLKLAAKLYRTTELKSCIGSLLELGDEAAPLAARLRALNESGDMAGMLVLLETLERTAEPAERSS